MPVGRMGSRLRAGCGVLGPVAFTAAWIVSGRRQEGYSIGDEHISGLAAPDARDPLIMTSGFLTLGICTIAFARELRHRLGGSGRAGFGPVLMAGAGTCVLAASVLRRDRMANVLPAEEDEPNRQSWMNDGHDYASIAGQTCSVLALLALAHRFRGDPEWSGLRLPTLVSATVTGGLGAFFATRTVRPGNGILQRLGITAALAAMSLVAIRLLRNPT
jgi:Protein of unknown function (DUF998)